MQDTNFTLYIKGELGTTVLPSDISAPNGPVVKAWQDFCRELDTAGIKIASGNFDIAGKKTALPLVGVHATAT